MGLTSMFDYQSKRWFGPALSPPTPPAWDIATAESLDLLISLASRYPSAMSTRNQLENIRRARESPP